MWWKLLAVKWVIFYDPFTSELIAVREGLLFAKTHDLHVELTIRFSPPERNKAHTLAREYFNLNNDVCWFLECLYLVLNLL